MSEPLKIRLVPRPDKKHPDFESYSHFVIFSQKKFTVLRPDEDGDDAILIVLPFWMEPFKKLTELIGAQKIGDYFSYYFVVEYINDTNTDLNDFRLGTSAYAPYNANDILRGQIRWSSIWSIQEHERALRDCERDNSLARAGVIPEECVDQDDMVLFRSCLSTTRKNNRGTVVSKRPMTRTKDLSRKRIREPDSDSDDASAFQKAKPPTATRASPRKNVQDTDTNNNDDGSAITKKHPKASDKNNMPRVDIVNFKSFKGSRFGDLSSFSPLSPGRKRNQATVKPNQANPPSSSRTDNINYTDLIECYSDGDEDYVPSKPNSERSSSPEPGPAVGNGGKMNRYTPFEDMAILRFLDEFKRHRYVAGYKTYHVMAKLDYFQRRNRTYQGLYNRYKQYLRPNLTSLLAKEPEVLRRFREGQTWRKENPYLQPAEFERTPPQDWEPREKLPGVK